MRRLAPGLLIATILGAACSPRTALAPADAERLRARPAIPVAWVRTGRPWVDCPTNEGQKTWEFPVNDRRRDGGVPPVQRAAWTGPVPSLRTVPAVGGAWESYQEQWTRPLAVPPLDPALATAQAFLQRNGADPAPLPLSPDAVEVPSADPAALARRFEGAPVLLFQVTRFNLMGCFFTYQPWFITRATLLDGASGRVLWTDPCDSTDYEDDWPPYSTRDDLLANGSARYLWFIEQRAGRCAGELLRHLGTQRAPPAR
jgi:hypothetical protein